MIEASSIGVPPPPPQVWLERLATNSVLNPFVTQAELPSIKSIPKK